MAGYHRSKPALSDLSVTEFLTLSRLGFLPRGMVIGVAIYDGGFEQQPTGMTVEVKQIGQAMSAARRLAVTRLREQANALGAEGVVGVRLSVEHHRWRGGHMVVKMVAIGTAIAFDASHAPPAFQRAPSLRLANGPFTSDLAGQEFVTLLRAGYRPISIALGSCVYEIATAQPTLLRQMGNSELGEYTAAFVNARETAMQNLESDLERGFHGADAPIGVVGMTVDEKAHPGALTIDIGGVKRLASFVEFMAVGTAIGRLPAEDPRRAAEMPAPTVVVPLDY